MYKVEIVPAYDATESLNGLSFTLSHGSYARKIEKKMEITGAVLDLDTTIELTQSRHNLEDLT